MPMLHRIDRRLRNLLILIKRKRYPQRRSSSGGYLFLELQFKKSKRWDAKDGGPAEDAEQEESSKEQQRACGGEELVPVRLFLEEAYGQSGQEAADQAANVT